MSKLPDRVQLHISHTPLRVDKMANHYLKPLLPLKAFNQLISQSFSYLFTGIEELKKLALFFSCFHSPFFIFNQTWFTNWFRIATQNSPHFYSDFNMMKGNPFPLLDSNKYNHGGKLSILSPAAFNLTFRYYFQENQTHTHLRTNLQTYIHSCAYAYTYHTQKFLGWGEVSFY